jgi:trigger factor
MEVKATKLNSANATASTKIDAKIIEKNQDKILNSLAKTAKVDGFRPGKVPASVIKARYADKVKQDAEQEAVKELFDAAIKELKIEASEIIGEPIFTKFERAEDGIDVELKISLRPQIKLDGYEKFIPIYDEIKVDKKEIDERVANLLKQSAPLKKVDSKRAVKNGDFVLIDFEGFIDEKAFQGGKADAYTLEIGSKSFIAGFEDGIVGMKADDTKDIQVTFPAEYGNKDLAGKDAVFKVKLLEIQEKDVPKEISEEFLKRFLPSEKNPTEDMLKEQVQIQIQNEKQNRLYNEELKPKFVDDLVKNIDFDLPDTIVEQEMDAQFRNIFRSISEADMEEFKNNPEKVKERRETFRE